MSACATRLASPAPWHRIVPWHWPPMRWMQRNRAAGVIPNRLIPYRNDYARDRDRVIHSRAFRRLEAKTQVFTTRYSDHFRNRLTHTIEVAQIARTVAGALRTQRRPRRSAGPGARHRAPALRPRGRAQARRIAAPARRPLRSQSAGAANRRAIRAALPGFSRPQSDVRSPRRHRQTFARL